MINALHLASGAPNDPNILGHFLNHLTGHSYVRVDSTDGNVQRNEAQGQGSVADLPKDKFTSSKGQHIPSSGLSPPSERESPPPHEELKVDDDTDEESFLSCSNNSVSADGVQESALFDSAECARFPQGNTSYIVNDPSFRLSWTMMTYGFGAVNSKGTAQRLPKTSPILSWHLQVSHYWLHVCRQFSCTKRKKQIQGC